ncbi:membrane protein [Sphingomonas metalli]|uniref:Methylamine utilization protein MauE n=1 Tax=Sphingomonas metalli TaxID=1779358 RepID=A0A916T7A3_9SPHN|nr:glutaredoxin family protein [Sphingomonas metalli]GGB32932.1 membrane protein [Sphingomonas metalli]
MARTATLYRMATPQHLCPFGLKARDLLRRQGYEVDDHLLTSRAAQDAFKAEHSVQTTPQAFIDGVRIGGFTDLLRHFGKPVPDPRATAYVPVIAIFAMAAAMAAAMSWASLGALVTARGAEWFVAVAMCLLALQKLRDVEGFTNGFLGYDLLARRWVPYAYVYPFAEALAGVLMLAGALLWLAVPVALAIGTIGAWSVIRAVYVERRELKCACVGGGSNVPLGFVSLVENVMMVGMALWMAVRG